MISSPCCYFTLDTRPALAFSCFSSYDPFANFFSPRLTFFSPFPLKAYFCVPVPKTHLAPPPYMYIHFSPSTLAPSLRYVNNLFVFVFFPPAYHFFTFFSFFEFPLTLISSNPTMQTLPGFTILRMSF